MVQWKAAVAVLFLEGPGWRSYNTVARRILELGLTQTTAKDFSQSVGLYFRENARDYVERSFGDNGMYRIRPTPEAKAWCQQLVRNHAHHFKGRYPQFFESKLPRKTPAIRRKAGLRRRVDPMLRCKVEKAAVRATTNHFRNQGYTVDSQEKDNVGWDLIAKRKRQTLRLEVKGLAGRETCVELTPNEYVQMQKWRDSYHVCVVTDALSDPKLAVFSFSPESGKWHDGCKRTLRISEIVAARCIAR